MSKVDLFHPAEVCCLKATTSAKAVNSIKQGIRLDELACGRKTAVEIVTWRLQEAKRRLSELVRLAKVEGSQEITVRGRKRLILATWEDWQNQCAYGSQKLSGSLGDFLRRYQGLDFHVSRRRDKIRRFRL